MAPGAVELPPYPSGREAAHELSEFGALLNSERLAAAEPEYDTAAYEDNDNAEGAHLLSDETRSTGSDGPLKNRPSRKRRRRSSQVRGENAAPNSLPRRTAIIASVFLATTTIIFLVIPAFIPETTHHYTGMTPQHDVRYSNGTHQFRKTVLMVSIDGLRADYLDRGLTPHLLNISHQGLRAKSMKPIFPTLTFPNHWSMLTGLYAESHGIVANDFYDPATDSKFHYGDSRIAKQGHWWGGEPIWETASKAGLTTANLMWLGPTTTQTGVKSTYFVPWRNNVPLKEKHDQIMKWIDLPFDKRPQLILAYEPHLDQVGHQAGPYSTLVNSVLKDVDHFAHSIHTSLRDRNLSNIVDVIFVSDHGMTNTSNTRLVYMDDIMGAEHTAQIEHQDGWPSVGLRMAKGTNVTDVLTRLQTSLPATSDPPVLDVYTEDTMPARYHFNPKNNERIAPIYVVPKIGWALTNQREHKVTMNGNYEPKGNHGYDNEETSMHAMFVADGPFATLMKKRRAAALKRQLRSPSSSPVGRRLSRTIRKFAGRFTVSAAATPDRATLEQRKAPQVIETFNNVELYGLIVKLLDLEKFSAPHNGTAGFWDHYLDDSSDED